MVGDPLGRTHEFERLGHPTGIDGYDAAHNVRVADGRFERYPPAERQPCQIDPIEAKRTNQIANPVAVPGNEKEQSGNSVSPYPGTFGAINPSALSKGNERKTKRDER